MPSVSRVQCWLCSVPSWLDVPFWWTLINLHSVSIHALLVLYPTVLLVVGGYRPSPRRIPQVLAFLFGSALPIYFLNKSLNTNFYFLNNPYGNIITSTFTELLGEKYYILGFLPAIALALVRYVSAVGLEGVAEQRDDIKHSRDVLKKKLWGKFVKIQ